MIVNFTSSLNILKLETKYIYNQSFLLRFHYNDIFLCTFKYRNHSPLNTDHVFPVTDVALRQSWKRLLNRANLIDFTFHDLKHETISRMLEKGLNVPEVESIRGHNTASQLFRYVQVNVRL